MSDQKNPVEQYVNLIEGQAFGHANPDRRRVDETEMRIRDFLTTAGLDPHDTTIVSAFHVVWQLLADEAARHVASQHLPPNDALLRAAAELWEAAQDMWDVHQITVQAEELNSGQAQTGDPMATP